MGNLDGKVGNQSLWVLFSLSIFNFMDKLVNVMIIFCLPINISKVYNIAVNEGEHTQQSTVNDISGCLFMQN